MSVSSSHNKRTYVEAVIGKQEKGRTREPSPRTAITGRVLDSGMGVRMAGGSRNWKEVRHREYLESRRKETNYVLIKAAATVLNTVQHDSDKLIVVTGWMDGVHCKDVLVDPGATSNFIRKEWATKVGLSMEDLTTPLEVRLGDGRVGATLTSAVAVKQFETQGSAAPCTLTVMEPLSHNVILGIPWLKKAHVNLDFGEDIHWNGRPMFKVNMRKAPDEVELFAFAVSPKHEKRMAAILREFPSAFSKELRERTAADVERAIKCHIELKDPNCRPVKCRERRRSPADELALRTAVEEMLAKGLVRPSKSEWVSQPVMVKKVRDGVVLEEKRPCWDYRSVNSLIKGDAFPLPLPENMFDSLQGSRVFSKLDLTKGFWQIPLEEASKAILAMSTPLGLMEPNNMPFGMKNAPSVFQREMQRVLRERLGKGLLIFIDDILIYSATVEEHEELVKWVLGRLREEAYYANPEKCEFFQHEISFLGHVISEEGISVQQHKVKAVHEWPRPETKKQVKGFLGLTGYYRKFVLDYSRIALPLTELTKDKTPFHWGSQHQEAFDTLKERLTEAEVLAHPIPSKQYILNTDASGFAIAAVLSQEQEDGTTRPVAYYSRKMGTAEVNYCIHDKELLAVVMAVDHWRCYLHGSPFPVKILTDHKGLQWLNSKAELTGREARWVERLSDVEYELKYIPGPQNAVADALSRRADFESRETETGASEECKCGRRLKIHLGEVSGDPVSERPLWEVKAEALSFREELKEAATADPWYMEKLKETSPSDGLLRGDGLLWTFDGRFYVPADREVQRKLLYEVHDAPTGGHLGERKTLYKLQRTCYWPGMKGDIEDYVRGCVVCAAIKPSQRVPAGLLQPLPIPHRPWEVISLDFVGPLVKTKDYHDAVLVVVDKFSKMAHFIPTTMKVTAAKTAKLLIDNVFKLHGLPSSLISDRDPRFTAGLWREVFKAWGTKLSMSSSYHPQTDGQTERVNRVLIAGLRAYADKKRQDWADWLPMVEAFYNNSRHESTGQTPFEMNGVVWTDATMLALHSPVMDDIKSQAAEDVLKGMQQAWEDARQLLLTRGERMKKNADKGRRDEKYEVGDRVLLSTAKLSKHQSKLSDPFIGPFTVTRVSDHGVNVWLDLPHEYRLIHQPFHIEKIKRYRPSEVEWGRQQVDRPLPELVDGQEMWEVETVLGKREGEEMVDIQPDMKENTGEEEDQSESVEGKEEETESGLQREQEATLRRSERLAKKGVRQADGTGEAGGRGAAKVKSTRKPRKVKQMVVRYLVKWKGYGEEDSTWEPADSLRLHAQDAIDEYEYRQACDRGEEVIGLHCLHSLTTEEEGSLRLQSVLVGGTDAGQSSIGGSQHGGHRSVPVSLGSDRDTRGRNGGARTTPVSDARCDQFGPCLMPAPSQP